MTENEFKTWLSDFCAAFPDTAAFINSSPDPKATRRMWQDALEDVEIRDANAVRVRLLRGDDPMLPAYERERTLAHLLKLCREQATRRLSRERAAKLPQQTADMENAGDARWSALTAFGAVLNAQHRGQDWRAALDRIIDTAEGEDRRDRYSCRWCLDSGAVIVFDPRTVKETIRLGELPSRLDTCVVACSCPAGHRYPKLRDRNDGRHVFACDDWTMGYWIPCVRGDTNDEKNRERLLEHSAEMDRRATRNRHNYVDEFDEFNSEANYAG